VVAVVGSLMLPLSGMSEYSFSDDEIEFGLVAVLSKICADRMCGKGWRLCAQLVAKEYNPA
jgi:hypothetical protein